MIISQEISRDLRLPKAGLNTKYSTKKAATLQPSASLFRFNPINKEKL